MALTEYEERVIAELEAQLRPDDGGWCDRYEPRARPVARRSAGRLAPALSALFAGAALLVAVRQEWFLVRVSNLSGLSSASASRAVDVIGCALVLGSALLFWRGIRRTPSSPPPGRPHPAG
jgi:hypothetical protein